MFKNLTHLRYRHLLFMQLSITNANKSIKEPGSELGSEAAPEPPIWTRTLV